MSAPPPEDDETEPERSNRANIAAVIAIVVLGILAYWAFTAIQHARLLQRCLDEGRRNCVDMNR